jgi:signal transduction histidine kinase/ligand-binding sensor domain-containing protein
LQPAWLAPVTAQVYTKARTLTTENGLSDNSIHCFYKDHTGYMWIGTRHGLNQYDGHAFKVFKPSTANSISNEVINAITGSPDGKIWVATMNGLNCYDPKLNKWHTLLPGQIPNRNDLPNNLVWDICFGKDGLLWIASDVFEFSSYNTKTHQFTYYDWPAFAKTIPTKAASRYTSIQKFVPGSHHEYWLGTTRGLVHLDTRTGRFKWLGAGFIGNVAGIYYDSTAGKVFLSAEEGKCFVYDEKDSSYKEMRIVPESYPSTLVMTNRHKELWLPASTGLLKIQGEKNSISLSRHIGNFSASLLPGAVKTVYKDNTGIRWIGTTNGVAVYDAGQSVTFVPLLPVSDKSASNNMGGLCFDGHSNSYFVCSLDPAAVFIVPNGGGTIQKITTDADGNRLSACNNIKRDNDDNLWLLTDQNVYRFDRTQQAFILFPTPNGHVNVGFRTFTQDAAGNYWFGTFLQSIHHYNTREKKFVPITFPFTRWTKKIGCLSYDPSRQSLWISAYASDVIRYDLPTGKMEGFENRPGLSALNMANDIITDHLGNTWIATSGGGVFRFDRDQKSFRCFDMRTGLSGNSFMSLCEDADGHIWLLSERGVDVIDPGVRRVDVYTNSQAFDFSTYTSDTRSPHTLFYNKQENEVATAVGGGLYLIPTTRPQRNRPFKVVVTGIRTGNRDTVKDQSTQQLLQQLPYDYNLLQFDFAGLYYGAPQAVFYEYKLSGYDRHWIRADHYSASYQNLPAGSYFFQVRARYNNGQIAGEIPGYTFEIVPPFWKTTLFIVAMALLFVAAMAWLVYSLLLKLKTEKTLHAFSSSLYGQNTIEDISWDTARNCVVLLGFTDCVIYWYEEDRQLLVQKAAYGPKNPWQREIYNSLAIPLGKGIVGSVALTGKMELIKDTSKDTRYIIDDEKRLSEICVPIFIDGKLFGVIDSEHPQKNFYTRHHARLLKKIASICAERIARYQAEEKLRGKIARDLHDEMGSTLTSINIMSKVAMESMPDATPVKDYLQKIKDNSGRILESIGDMVWVINPANDNFERLLFRMKEFTAEMLEPLRINYHFKEEGILHAVQLNVEQRKEIYMIFKEAITNAAKYSDTADLFITLTVKNSILSMEIADQGVGFNRQQVMQGNGLKNMASRAAQIGAELIIETAKDKGSTILFRLPLP